MPSIEELEQRIADLSAQLAEVRAAQAPPAPTNPTTAPSLISMELPGTSAPKPRGPRVDTPERFDGDRTKARSFLAQCALYIGTRQAEFPNDQAMVHFVLSYMKGSTLVCEWVTRIVNWEIDKGLNYFSDFQAFLAEFNQSFSDPDPASTAHLQMEQAAQGTPTADAYIAEFKQIASRTGYDDNAHIWFFQRGLKNSIVEKIYPLPIMPTTITQWYEYATRFDTQWHRFQAWKKPTTPARRHVPILGAPPPISAQPRTHIPVPTIPPSIPVGDSAAMDVDSNRRCQPPNSGEERKH